MSEQNKLSRRTFVSATASVAALAVLNPTISFADPTSAEVQAQAESALASLNAMQESLNQASNDYFTALDEHDAAIKARDAAQKRLDEINDQIYDLQRQLGTRARSMYRSGSTSFLDVLLGATSWDEFATNWDVLNTMNENDAAMVQQTKDLREEAQRQKDEYVHQEAIAQEKEEVAEAVKAQAEQTVAAQQEIYNSLSAEASRLLEEERKAAEAAAAAQAAAASAAAAAAASSYGGGQNAPEFSGDISAARQTIISAAYSQIGVPYVWGGTSPGVGLDCSGLTQYCYRCAGISIPRVDTGQRDAGNVTGSPKPGDICWSYGHVAIYIGNGQMIEAQQTGTNIMVSAVRVSLYISYLD